MNRLTEAPRGQSLDGTAAGRHTGQMPQFVRIGREWAIPVEEANRLRRERERLRKSQRAGGRDDGDEPTN